MGGDDEPEFTHEFSEVFLPPQITDGPFAGKFKIGPVGGHGGVVFTKVEETDCFRAILEVFGVNAEVAVFENGESLFAEGVLVNGEDFVVGEQVKCEFVELIEIATEQQGS